MRKWGPCVSSRPPGSLASSKGERGTEPQSKVPEDRKRNSCGRWEALGSGEPLAAETGGQLAWGGDALRPC